MLRLNRLLNYLKGKHQIIIFFSVIVSLVISMIFNDIKAFFNILFLVTALQIIYIFFIVLDDSRKGKSIFKFYLVKLPFMLLKFSLFCIFSFFAIDYFYEFKYCPELECKVQNYIYITLILVAVYIVGIKILSVIKYYWHKYSK
jgi:hypothetical protein